MTQRAQLSNGRFVDLRTAGPRDFTAVRDFYKQLDDDSTYSRFFGIRRQIPDDELRAVVGSGPRHVTMLAISDERLIGIGEYIVGAQPTEAEVAFVVAADHHREGIATLLLERLARIARARGLLEFRATVLPSNADMQLVFRTVGLTSVRHVDGGIIDITLDLASIAALEQESRLRAAHASVAAAPVTV